MINFEELPARKLLLHAIRDLGYYEISENNIDTPPSLKFEKNKILYFCSYDIVFDDNFLKIRLTINLLDKPEEEFKNIVVISKEQIIKSFFRNNLIYGKISDILVEIFQKMKPITLSFRKEALKGYSN